MKAAFSQLNPILTDSSQRGRCIGAHGKVIEADDAYVCRNTQTELLALNDGGIGQQVMAADERCGTLLQKTGKVLFQALRNIIGASGLSRASLQAVLTHGMKKGAVADLHDIRPESAAQVTDFFVSEFSEM